METIVTDAEKSTRRPIKRSRCAIYTRKSTEEGLEQNFNSLDAQREACTAFVQSQKHEGWTVITTEYDDGGYSGGTMERPGLQRLLADIESGRIDVIVVYKVDRLTRALSDFAKLVEIFDRCGVSFISITQHGAPDAQYPAVVCSIRARADWRAGARQDCRLQEKGHVDGRHCATRV
jgi:DNA invertase Pin-like site-specific DNA recombinase